LDKKKIALYVDKVSHNKKYQKIFNEKYPDMKAVYNDKITDDFLEWCNRIIMKKLSKKKSDKESKGTGNVDIYRDADIVDELAGGTLSATRIKVPAVFNITYDQYWVPIIKQEMDLYKKGMKPRVKSFLVFVEGLGKTGKTHFAQSAVEFKGYRSKYRIIPPGRPVYVIEADEANRQEAETKWYKYLPSKVNPEGYIHIADCYIESPETSFIDPEATLKNMYAAIFSLKDRQFGTLVIDPYSLLCDMILFVYLLKRSVDDGEEFMTFDEFLKPDRIIPPTEHQYKKKLIYELLRKLRRFTMNVILIGNLKPIYKADAKAKNPNSIYAMKPSGQYESDVQKGTEYWVDVIARMYKKKEVKTVKNKAGDLIRKTITRRYLAVTDSRFENKEIDDAKYIFVAPTFSEVINHLMEVYPK